MLPRLYNQQHWTEFILYAKQRAPHGLFLTPREQRLCMGPSALYLFSASFAHCVPLDPFGEAGECSGEGKWSCLPKSLIWIPVFPQGGWSAHPVHKFAEREKRSHGLGVSVPDEGGIPREILRPRLCGGLAGSGERARLALLGCQGHGHLDCEGKSFSAGNFGFSSSWQLSSHLHATKL